MGAKIRTFVAIELPTARFRDFLQELTGIGPPVRVVAEPLHLTLKFLGETDRFAVDAISAAIAGVCGQHAPLDLRLQTVGTFPRPERPTVVWAGVCPIEPLAALVADLESQLSTLGFPAESREFHPHVTLARVKGRPPRGLAELLELYAEETFGSVSVRSVVLYQSVLSREGPRYTVLNTAELKRRR